MPLLRIFKTIEKFYFSVVLKTSITTGYLARYAALVTSGNRGAVLEVK